MLATPPAWILVVRAALPFILALSVTAATGCAVNVEPDVHDDAGPAAGDPCDDECSATLGCAAEVHGGTVQHRCASAGPRATGAACLVGPDCRSRVCADFLCAERCADGEPHRVVADDGESETTVALCTAPKRGPDLVLPGITTTAEAPSAELSFQVPDGVTGFTLTVLDDDGLALGTVSLVAPDGTVVVDGEGNTGLQNAERYFGASTTLVPGTDDARARVQPGTWRYRVRTWDSLGDARMPVAGDVERAVVWFTRTGEDGGLLDLELHVAPGTGLTAATAPEAPFMLDALTRVQALLQLADVSLGDVHFHDLGAASDVVDSGDEARALCVASSVGGASDRAANIFVTQDLTFAGGFSGGIPGPTGLVGTPASGIVAEPVGSGAQTGVVFGHELSHFLGLRHTTEVSGAVDFIADTPSCASGTPVEQCPDYPNLMFPIFPLDASHTLSAGQIAILRRNPALREDSSEALCAGAGGAVDITDDGVGNGDSTGLAALTAGSCGGDGAPERLYVYRVLEGGLDTLELHVRAANFDPVVHVRFGSCDDSEQEVACSVGVAGEDVVLNVSRPAAGPYFVTVDGVGSAGRASVRVVPLPP